MAKAISTEFSTVMVISKSEIEKIIAEDKHDFEKYKEIADKIFLNDNFSDIKPICHSCTSRYHASH